MTCDKCRFAVLDRDSKQLWCHLTPPKPLALANGDITHTYAAVRANWWCGGFKLAWKRLFRGHGGA